MVCAVRPLEQRIGLRVIGDSLGDRIKLQGSSDSARDVSEMRQRCGKMSFGDAGIRTLSRWDEMRTIRPRAG